MEREPVSYWKYYRQKRKMDKLKKEVEKLQKVQEENQSLWVLLGMIIHYLKGESVNAERIARYRRALFDLRQINLEYYYYIAPVCEEIIKKLEQKLKEKKSDKI
jgi:hypothetical protein